MARWTAYLAGACLVAIGIDPANAQASRSYSVVGDAIPTSLTGMADRSMSSITGGRGSFTLELSHYEIMPPNEQQKVIAAAQMKEEEE